MEQSSHRTQISTNMASQPQNILPVKIDISIENPVTSSCYLTNDSLIALGKENGQVLIVASNKGSNQYLLKSNDKSPVTSISLNSDKLALKNAILLTHTNGTLEYWHTTSKQLLFEKKYDQFLYSCAISNDATRYIFAGDKGHIYLSHMNKGTPVALEEGHIGAHSNRVFCLKWSYTDENIFISGGWDRTVFFWDARTKTAVQKLFGCYIGGQSIDMIGNEVLIGSNSKQFPLKIYDTKASKMRTIDWFDYDQQSNNSVTGVLSCCFAKNDPTKICVQTARNQIRLYTKDRCTSIFREKQESKAFSMARANQKDELIATWSNGNIQIITYQQQQ